MYGEPTNPIPFIVAAYVIGFILISGYMALLIWQRFRGLQVKAALEDNGGGKDNGVEAAK